MTAWRDPSEEWDGRLPRSLWRDEVPLSDMALIVTHPHLNPYWAGPTNPDEARAADRIMVDLGRVILLQNSWELGEEMRRIEKRNGF